MNSVRKKSRLVLSVVGAAYLACSTGCDDSAAKVAEAKYYQQQLQILERQSAEWEQQTERQNAEWERQTERIEAQDKRYEAILAKWEKHIERVDALLDRSDRILGVLEERSRDR